MNTYKALSDCMCLGPPQPIPQPIMAAAQALLVTVVRNSEVIFQSRSEQEIQAALVEGVIQPGDEFQREDGERMILVGESPPEENVVPLHVRVMYESLPEHIKNAIRPVAETNLRNGQRMEQALENAMEEVLTHQFPDYVEQRFEQEVRDRPEAVARAAATVAREQAEARHPTFEAFTGNAHSLGEDIDLNEMD